MNLGSNYKNRTRQVQVRALLKTRILSDFYITSPWEDCRVFNS